MSLIIAGGKGTRFGAEIPKQFVEISDKPIIYYTLQAFEKSTLVDTIAIVCIKDWIGYLKEFIDKYYKHSKIEYIIPGGETRFHSIYNGVSFFKDILKKDDIITIHDAVRPFITVEMLESSISVAKEYGASLAVASCYDTMYISENHKDIVGIYPRENIYKGQTPESMYYSVALNCYQASFEDKQFIDPPTKLLMYMKQRVGLSEGGQNNIKITTKEDVLAFKMILEQGFFS